MNQYAITLLLLFLFPLLSLSKNLHSMTRDAVTKAFVGNTLTSIGVDNLNGKMVNASNIVYLDKKGVIYGKLGRQIAHVPQYDQGKYQIQKGGSLMITWSHWDFSKPLCFNLFEVKNAYLSIDCQGVYHSTFMKSAVQSGRHV